MSSNSTADVASEELSNPYDRYVPSLAMAVIFLIIFSGSTLLHLLQIFVFRRPGNVKKSMKWMVVFPICGFVEIIGWGGRLWSHFAIYGDGYLMQICCLTIAPTFISAGLYMLLGVLIQRISPSTSPLSAKKFKIVFIVADVVSLVIQAAGGGMAATSNTQSGGQTGGRIMLVGIIVQLIVMIIFVAYFVYWALRSRPQLEQAAISLPGGEGIVKAVIGMGICSLMIIVRGFYRSAELGDGFSGAIATNQMLFLLDAIPVAIAMWSINAFPPAKHFACLEGISSSPSQDSVLELKEGASPEMSRV
ncbi:RTA1 like protein-domain-containing protein [Leucosporidium creatinivorum]|uniref:RTA1 like protein-domain-containing protein n=1 Tax=Leucosporidium creatinivorum TaxID=106004 RepID=A0A1Y2CNW9_9BASI|nr:RTA1 like protein-domain-containing protein [Leucosporidium creatinivorum]